jgi:thiol:disulfide interchange protein
MLVGCHTSKLLTTTTTQDTTTKSELNATTAQSVVTTVQTAATSQGVVKKTITIKHYDTSKPADAKTGLSPLASETVYNEEDSTSNQQASNTNIKSKAKEKVQAKLVAKSKETVKAKLKEKVSASFSYMFLIYAGIGLLIAGVIVRFRKSLSGRFLTLLSKLKSKLNL